MPISRRDFDNGEKPKDDSSSKALGFLRQNADSAFEINEIAAEIGWREPSRVSSKVERFGRNLGDTMTFRLSLQELVQKGLVDEKMYQGKLYYSIHRG